MQARLLHGGGVRDNAWLETLAAHLPDEFQGQRPSRGFED
eukprot:CAMPEP_0179061124 /NCGR_PEP_ID=MMETSP0796-20121207/26224_1 /TAXON_ID=73915 /ORGANISM="Pyrodinium bahamense, Strain pbaha01" /LENGTH=39 /DNA_ID= /DNA_START= /DNA_END= /DNA_ORIENTATION=